MNKDKVLEFAGWAGISIMAIWVILKMIGIIHSPVWVEMIPYAGGIFTGGIAFKILIDLSRRTNILESDVKEIKKETHIIDKRMILVESKL